ncbi:MULTISPECIES: ABC transporter permease [Rhizobium/Agrobacterium group]|uniref:ABC transporter permease n=1 Tax=Rhizobium/Agrobacterium group TaxID=227290 RepID=UPI00087638AE|nr:MULTISPECIES: ABC transporter permease [Rhizobium/Agrobacterium group]MCP2137747.1 peptide/nickel transport system permease protein [Rhizobium sp. SLBN-94]MDP9855340.1 peptide/nickel transport system permease protein [Agrobacterium tumefaciens]SCY80371.1 peptide/nickel transport system permease protein [Rhizobium sp. NFACC06-2]
MTSLARTIRTMPLTALIGLIIIVIYVVVVAFAPMIAPYDQAEIVGAQFEPWSTAFPLGTDALGRDMLSRLIWGARNTVGIAVTTTVLAFALGAVAGLLAAALGKWFDLVLSRIVDVMMAVPPLILTLLALSALGSGVVNLILIVAVLDSTRVFRLARATAANVMVMDYVEAAKLRGDGIAWIILKEVLPNITAPLIAEFGLRFCFVFLTISALAFLGLGLPPPMADWGAMVRDNAALITFGDITPLLPAACIAVLTVSINFVVDWMLHRASGLKD